MVCKLPAITVQLYKGVLQLPLVSQPIMRPVIVHSSNSERASWMAGEFDLAGWRHWRVAPIGDDWIESDWRQVVRLLLNDARKSESCK
jgi:hypothetical protein